MNITISSKNYVAGVKLEEVITKKVQKLERYFSDSAEVKVMCRKDNDRSKMEVTINDKGIVYRAEVTGENMYDNIDLVLPKIENQLYKQRDKVKHNLRKDAFTPKDLLFLKEEAREDATPKIARTKAFQVYPYTAEEAAERLENLGLNFFIYQNKKTNTINVIYRRDDGDYGVIEPQY